MPIDRIIRPRPEHVAEQPILRPLPSAQCRALGPFVFFDHMLPNTYAPGQGIYIHAHPHIGLSTLTYLFEGQLQHKDSLGSDQVVGPGEVSWMTAGAGIAHVERTPEPARIQGGRIHGLQVWLASPVAHEQGPASYAHFGADALPEVCSEGLRIRLIAGHGFGMTSPVPVLSPTLYADIELGAGQSLTLTAEHAERGAYLWQGEAQADGQALEVQTLAVLAPGEPVLLHSAQGARLVVLGGAPLDSPRRIFWNFVASDVALIEQAKARWARGDWPGVPGEPERIPLPG